jgi:hypothetical protein
VVGNAANGSRAIAMVPDLDSDVVLKKLRKPSKDRVAAIERVHAVVVDRGPIAQQRDEGLRPESLFLREIRQQRAHTRAGRAFGDVAVGLV